MSIHCDVTIIGVELTKEEIEEETLRFIAAIEQRPGIWNRSSPVYKQASIKEHLFAEVERQLGWDTNSVNAFPGQRAKANWSRLLSSLRRCGDPTEAGSSRNGALPVRCIQALSFYSSMIDQFTARKEARRASSSSSFHSNISTPETRRRRQKERDGEVSGSRREEESGGEEDEERRVKDERTEKAWEESEDDDEEGGNEQTEVHGAFLPETESKPPLAAAHEGTEESEEEGEILRFIGAIRSREGLWKRSSAFYRMPHMKMVWFGQVEDEVGMPFCNGQNARHRWIRLLSAYRHFLAASSAGFSSSARRDFKYFDAMSFYKESYKSSVIRRNELSKRRAEAAASSSAGPLSPAPSIPSLARTRDSNADDLTGSSYDSLPSGEMDASISSTKIISQMLDSTLAAMAGIAHGASSLPCSSLPVTPSLQPLPSVSLPLSLPSSSLRHSSIHSSNPAPVVPSITLAPAANFPLATKSARVTGRSEVESAVSRSPPLSPLHPPPSASSTPHLTSHHLASDNYRCSQRPRHNELYALMDHALDGLPLIAATEAKGEIISFLVQLRTKYDARRATS